MKWMVWRCLLGVEILERPSQAGGMAGTDAVGAPRAIMLRDGFVQAAAVRLPATQAYTLTPRFQVHNTLFLLGYITTQTINSTSRYFTPNPK